MELMPSGSRLRNPVHVWRAPVNGHATLWLQIINISSTLGSIGKMQESLCAPKDSFPAALSHIHLAYRSSKAALNMREYTILAQYFWIQTPVPMRRTSMYCFLLCDCS